VARSVPSIAWHQAAAEAIPLPDERFDVVLCGMGLQFFSDRPAALREMRRVLVPGGRLVANVPGPTPPIFAAMAEALSRHVGPDVAGFVPAVFALHEADAIRTLLTDAGLRDVEVRSAPRRLRLPAPEEFLWHYVHSTPMAAAFSQVDEERRAALTRDFAERCEPFVAEGALGGEVTISTMLARR
jgi:SAM-dependent methyltransferase